MCMYEENYVVFLVLLVKTWYWNERMCISRVYIAVKLLLLISFNKLNIDRKIKLLLYVMYYTVVCIYINKDSPVVVH